MAWQVSKVSSQLCKRFESSFKWFSYPSLITAGSYGDLDCSLSLLSRSNSYHHSKSIARNLFPRVPASFCVSETLSFSPTNFFTNSSICRGVASVNDGRKSHFLKAQPFSSTNWSYSRQLEGIQDLREVGNGDGEIVDADILHTEDGQVLYAGMKSAELLSTLLNLHLVAYEPLVDLSIEMLKSPLMSYAVYRQPLLATVKRTAFAHFCAGDGVAEASKTLQQTWELGLKSILDYSLEDAMDNSCCDRNLTAFLQTVHQTNQLPSGSVSFSCVKMTALCPLSLLERISSLLRWQHIHTGFVLQWREEALPLFSKESPLYHVRSPPEPLTDKEEGDLQLAKERLWKLCRACEEASLPLLVDAEYTSVQPAIDYYTYSAASEFNKSEYPLVYGTIQAYLKDSFPRLRLATNEAARRGVSFGVKLVRGAYITKESAQAASLGVESPIHSCIEKTHECYDTCAAYMMERVVSGQGAVVLATHNFDSGRAAAVRAEDLGVLKGNPRLQFLN